MFLARDAAGGAGAAAGAQGNRLLQRFSQARRIFGIQEKPAGVFCKAGNLAAFFCAQSETDDMRREVDAQRFQLRCNSTRVGLAGFNAVCNEDNRRFVFLKSAAHLLHV